MSSTLSAADHVRLNTYMVEIASAARGTAIADSSGNYRFGSSRSGLCVYANGQFHDFSANAHGFNAIQLIQHLYPNEDATSWARAWLAQHPGDGAFVPGEAPPPDDFAEATAMSFIDNLYSGAPLVNGTPGYVYVTQTRGLPLLPEDQAVLKWIPDYRGNEGALLAPMTDDDGKLAKLLVTYVTPDGQKSPHLPNRKQINGAKRRGLCRLGSPGPRVVEAEGLEKGLAARAAGESYVVVHGGSDWGRIHLPPCVQTSVFARDDDPPASLADCALWTGAVHRLGQGLKVAVASRPNEIAPTGAPFLKDADDLYRFDPELVPIWLKGANLEHRRLGSAVENAILDEVSRLDDVALDRARLDVAKSLLGMSTVSRFDDAIDAVRKARKAQKAQWAQQEGETLLEEEPWPDPVTDIGAVMDEATVELRRYVVMDEPSLHTTVVWAVFAHLIHQEQLKINVAPRYAIQSSDPDMGKTTLLEGLACLTPRPNMVGSTTASSIFRTIDGRRPTYLLDEIDNLLHSNADPILKAILNSGHRKRSAYAERSEKQPDGSFEVLLLSTWAAIATAGIGELYPPLQSRSLIITLSKATGNEQPEHMIDGESEALFCCRRKFARWARDLTALPVIDRPKELLNRKGDNWYPLRQIAQLAGEKWTKRILTAATRITTQPSDPKGGVALLEDIWTVFDQANLLRLPTLEIIAKLIALEESPWREANHGKEITPYYLPEAFKPYFKAWEGNDELHKAREWRVEGRKVTGYSEEHFEDAWLRHTQKLTPTKTKKAKEEEAKKQAEKEGIYTSPLGQASGTPPPSPQKPKTQDGSEPYAVRDGSEASGTGQRHRGLEPEHHGPEGLNADGGEPSPRSNSRSPRSKNAILDRKNEYNQGDNLFGGDGPEVPDAPARGEGIVPPSDSVSLPRGAHSRRPGHLTSPFSSVLQKPRRIRQLMKSSPTRGAD
jgi:hypothetical protein